MVPGDLRERLNVGPVVACLVTQLTNGRFAGLTAKAEAGEASSLSKVIYIHVLINETGDRAVCNAAIPEFISALNSSRPVFTACSAGIGLDRNADRDIAVHVVVETSVTANDTAPKRPSLISSIDTHAGFVLSETAVGAKRG